jgi:hypothetical protein
MGLSPVCPPTRLARHQGSLARLADIPVVHEVGLDLPAVGRRHHGGRSRLELVLHLLHAQVLLGLLRGAIERDLVELGPAVVLELLLGALVVAVEPAAEQRK